MADTIKKIRTPNGDLPIDYNALANKPDLDKKLNTSGGTVTGDLTIEGDLRVQGDAVETHLENVKIPQNSLTLRDGATQSLLNNEYTGIIAEKYDGANDGMLVFDKGGTAYVGDKGDLQPLATRAASADMPDGEFTKWNSSKQRIEGSGVSAAVIENMQTEIDSKPVSSQKYANAAISNIKNVPANSANYAELNKIGGMSYKSKNLIPFPYSQNSRTHNGITWTVNADGSVTANGTATEVSEFEFITGKDRITIPAGYYTLSGCPAGGSDTTYKLYVQSADYSQTYGSTGEPVTKQIYVEEKVNSWARIYAGTTVTNLTFKPMFNEGTTALPFEAYFGLRDSKVTEIKSVGANLIPFPYKNDSKEINGVKFTVNTDGSITAKGTATDRAYFYLCDSIEFATESVYSNAGNTVRDGKTFQNVSFFKDTNAVFVSVNKGETVDKTFYPMIHDGVEALPYEPYKEHTLSIPAEVQALDGYGLGVSADYYNYISWNPDNNIKTWNKVVNKVTFTGKEYWGEFATTSGGVRFQAVQAITPKYTDTRGVFAISSHYNSVSSSDTWADIDGVATRSDSIEIKDNRFTTAEAFKAFLAAQYAAGTPVTVVYVIANPEVIDISDLVIADNLINVEGNGTLIFENEYNYNVPSIIQFYENTNELISADEFIGDLTGTAKRAIADKGGRSIEHTYATKIEMNERLVVSAKKTYSGIKYQENVPSNVANYANIYKLGGMTNKSKNLFIASQVNKTALGLTMSYSNGLIKINGTKTDGANVQTVIAPNITLPAGTYTISCKMVGGSITPSESFQYGVFFAINKSDYAQRTTPGVAKVGDVGTRVITLSEPTVISSFDIIPDFGGAGTVFNNALFEMQFEAGNTVTDYQEGFDGLRNSKVTEIKSIGANLWDEAWETGFIETGSGINASSAVRIRSKNYIPCESETVYSINLNSDNTIFYFYDKNKRFIGIKYTYLQRVTSYTNSCYMRFVTSDDYGPVYKNDLIIIKGSAALPYSPYKEHTLPIPEAVQALDGFGWSMSESVYNYIDWEKKQFVKRVEKLILNGSNVTWTSYGSAALYNTNLMNNAKKYNNSAVYALCSYIPYTANAKYLNSYFIARVSNDNGLQFNNVLSIYGLSSNTSAEFNAYLADHPMTFIYELAEPIITDISDMLPNRAIQVEDNGTLTFVNEFNYDVPYEMSFYDKIDEIVAAKEIVGNLTGTASMAQCDATGRNIATGYVKQEPIYYHQFKVQKYKNGNFVTDMWNLGATISFNGLKCFILNSAGERVYLSSIYTNQGSGTIYTSDGGFTYIYSDEKPELYTIYFYDKEGAEAWSGTQYEGSHGGNPIEIVYVKPIFDNNYNIVVGDDKINLDEYKGLEFIGSLMLQAGELGWSDDDTHWREITPFSEIKYWRKPITKEQYKLIEQAMLVKDIREEESPLSYTGEYRYLVVGAGNMTAAIDNDYQDVFPTMKDGVIYLAFSYYSGYDHVPDENFYVCVTESTYQDIYYRTNYSDRNAVHFEFYR